MSEGASVLGVRQWPDAASVLRVCRQATAGDRGDQVVTPSAEYAATGRGVRVSLTSPAAREDALRFLAALGYVAVADGEIGVPVVGYAVLVTGWSMPVLEGRATWLEAAVAVLETQHVRVADVALVEFRQLVDDGDVDEAQAGEQVLACLARPAAEAIAGLASTEGLLADIAVPVSGEDLDRGAAGTRALLVRVAAAQHAAARLVEDFETTVRNVIGLYEERQREGGATPDDAAVEAMLEVSEGVPELRVVMSYDLKAQHIGLRA